MILSVDTHLEAAPPSTGIEEAWTSCASNGTILLTELRRLLLYSSCTTYCLTITCPEMPQNLQSLSEDRIRVYSAISVGPQSNTLVPAKNDLGRTCDCIQWNRIECILFINFTRGNALDIGSGWCP